MTDWTDTETPPGGSSTLPAETEHAVCCSFMNLLVKCCCDLKQCRCILCVDVLLVNNIWMLLSNTNSSVSHFHLFTLSNLNLTGSLVDTSNICVHLIRGFVSGQTHKHRVLHWALLDLLPSVHLAAADAHSAEGHSFGFIRWGLFGGCIGQQFWRRNRTLLLISYFFMHYVCLWLCGLHVSHTSCQSCSFSTGDF